MNKSINEEYQDLYKVIPEAFEKFTFCNYYTDESKYLKPALEKLGYTNVHFVMGERDSFGPLSRVVIAKKDGVTVKLVYG